MLKASKGYEAATLVPDIWEKCLHICGKIFLLCYAKWSFREGRSKQDKLKKKKTLKFLVHVPSHQGQCGLLTLALMQIAFIKGWNRRKITGCWTLRDDRMLPVLMWPTMLTLKVGNLMTRKKHQNIISSSVVPPRPRCVSPRAATGM